MPYDAIIVGGGFAGLAAATYLARGRRSVYVLDAGSPRNRFAEHSHGFLGQDGADPRAILDAARTQLQAYPQVRVEQGQALAARATGAGFEVNLGSGDTLQASRIILAFGVSDVLPSVPGLADRWGKSVLHCPYCHGFEFSDRQLGVLWMSQRSAHQAMLIAEWGPTTLFLDGRPAPDPDILVELARRGVRVEPGKVAALEGVGPGLSHLRLEDGRRCATEALYVSPPTILNSPLAEQLGCVLDDGLFGPVIRTNADKSTTVAGVYAAGDIARAPHSVSWAAADGVTAGIAAHRSLVSRSPPRLIAEPRAQPGCSEPPARSRPPPPWAG